MLELGCGHGLPGILCMLAGALVHLQVRGIQGLGAWGLHGGFTLTLTPDGLRCALRDERPGTGESSGQA